MYRSLYKLCPHTDHVYVMYYFIGQNAPSVSILIIDHDLDFDPQMAEVVVMVSKQVNLEVCSVFH